MLFSEINACYSESRRKQKCGPNARFLRPHSYKYALKSSRNLKALQVATERMVSIFLTLFVQSRESSSM
jgi:hypothetical protein